MCPFQKTSLYVSISRVKGKPIDAWLRQLLLLFFGQMVEKINVTHINYYPKK